MSFVEEPVFVARITPIGEEPLSADDELALVEDTLTRTPLTDIVAAETLVPTTQTAQVIGSSWAWDAVTKRFIGEGYGGSPVRTTHLATLEGWIEKCLRTARGAHPIHSDQYGLERPFDIIGQPVTSRSDVEQRVRAALLFHPRIVNVTNFSREAIDEALFVSFEVVLDDDTTLPITSVRIA